MSKNVDVIKETVETYENSSQLYKDTHHDIKIMKNALNFFIEHLSGKKILDIGCGTGRDAKYLSKKGMNLTCIDLSKSFLKVTSNLVPKAEVLEMDMRHLSFENNSFDGIWICASFSHIPKKEAEKTLIGFERVLKQNGLLYISVKRGEGERFEEKKHYLGKRKYFSFYSEEEIRKLLELTGFEIIKTNVEQYKDNSWLEIHSRKSNFQQ